MAKPIEIKGFGLQLGVDPEFFFRKDGKIVPSSSVVGDKIETAYSKIIPDGVQAEINVNGPYTCRAAMGSVIQLTLLAVANAAKDSGTTIDLSTTVEIDKDTFDNLPAKDKMFGCKPSFTLHGMNRVGVDPLVYRKRSAGGHIHLGSSFIEYRDKLQDPEVIIPLLDALVGNTFVLLDRDEGNVERRKHYGKAGEFRLPKYGIEYRTLSNFWLRSYPLMSLATGACRCAALLAFEKDDTNRKDIASAVDYADVETAINDNDFALALKNFDKLAPVLSEIFDNEKDSPYYAYSLSKELLAPLRKIAVEHIDISSAEWGGDGWEKTALSIA